MEVIIKVNQEKIGDEKVNSVSARDLYQSLGVNRDFSTWIKTQINRINLLENQDYICSTLKGESIGRGGDRRSKEYILTIDIAKHIAMMSGTKKGFEVREYFIQIEKEYQTKLLKGSQKYKTLLESEKSKTINLSLQLQQCKDKLEATQKEKNYIKSNALLKFQDMELETSKAINQFKSLKLKILSKDNIPQNIFLDMIDNLFTLLNIHSQILGEDFQ